MGRSSRLLLTLLVGALTASVSLAGVPDPDLSTVPNVIVNPDGSFEYKVTVVGGDGPIDSALVQIVFSAETDGLLCWCTGQDHPVVEAFTDASGCAIFNIAAGGCIDSSLVASPPAVEVFANSIKIGEPGVVSPDVVDPSGNRAQEGWDPDGTCLVSAGDAVEHTPAIVNATLSFCTDLNSDGEVSPGDAVLITPAIVDGSSCTQAL
jgi:hypothetical protein